MAERAKKKKKKKKMLLRVTIAAMTMPRSRVKEQRRSSQETQALGVEHFAQLGLGGLHVTCTQAWEPYFCSFS